METPPGWQLWVGGGSGVVKRAGRRLETQETGPHRGEGMEPRGRFRNHPQSSLYVAYRSPRFGQGEPLREVLKTKRKRKG